MIVGVFIALIILILGFIIGLHEPNAETTYGVVILLATLALVLTLATQTAPKSAVEELEKLQKYCVSIGIATMTPVITESKFTLIPQAEELPYVTATGSIEINERK